MDQAKGAQIDLTLGNIMNKNLREEYIGRINRVIDHISLHLDEPLTLESLACVAAFSPYHFHRIFTAIVGEPLGSFLKRLRLEKAAIRLAATDRLTVTDVALDCGFSSSATFARAFKERFGMSASEWRAERRKECKTNSNNGKANSNIGKVGDSPAWDTLINQAHKASATNPRSGTMNIEVQDCPSFCVAYARARGPYQKSAEEAWDTLCKWAGPRGLLGPQSKMIGISHDDPTVTPPAKLRYDACVTVGEEITPERNINITELPAGKYARASFEGSAEQIQDAYNQIFGNFLPEQGYQPGDSPCYELYHNDPKQDGKFIMDIFVPVKPL